MNITVPMRARKSNSRVAPKLFGLSFRRIRLPSRSYGRKRYVFSLLLFAINIAALTIGSVGMVSEQVDAKSPYNFQTYDNYGRSQNGKNSNSRYTQTPSQNKSVTPSQAASTTPPATPATTNTPPANTQTNTPAKSTATQVPKKAVAPPPVDTAPQAAATTAAQEKSSNANPVVYQSQQISTETRNRLLALSVSAVTSGVLIFIMSFFTFGTKPTKRAIPVYYAHPSQEVSLR
jgi:cytoskeletal protein RodZ